MTEAIMKEWHQRRAWWALQLVLWLSLGCLALFALNACLAIHAQTARTLRVASANAVPGQVITVPVELLAQGDENALGFSLTFNPAQLSYQQANPGNAASGALFLVNPANVNNGRLGITLALPAEQRFAAGTRQLVLLTFSVAANASGTATLSFSDDPIVREVADANANALASQYVNGTLTIAQTNPIPVLSNLNLTSASVNSGAFTLTVQGRNFINGSIVRWNGADRATTFVSATELQAAILASDTINSGTISITVFNPAPAGGTSNALMFAITPATQNNPAPGLISLEPSVRIAGSSGFTLFLNGSNFLNGSTVRWNGTDRLTSFISPTRLAIDVFASDVASAGTAQLTVFNPAPGGGLSNTLLLTIAPPNPAPTLTALAPGNVNAGSSALTLTVTGTNFVNGATVRWNGANRTTTFVSATQLNAQIPANDVANSGTASVTVFNPEPGGGLSNALTFTITVPPNPAPQLNALSPASTVAGSGAFTLTVTGSNFVTGATVRWNGADRATTFVNATQLTAQIPASDVAASGSASVTIFNPASAGGGGGTSNALAFTISVPPNPAPVLTSLQPNTINAGSGAFTLTINGSNFLAGSIVRWNGADRPTTFVNATQLTAQLSAADVASVGSANVTVFNPASAGGGGGVSNALGFAIGQPPNPVPVLTALTPSQAIAGSAALTLTVTGNNFLSSSVVRWKGTDRATTFVSATQLRATINASDLVNEGTAAITVFNPAPGGGVSNVLIFSIDPPPNPAPVLTTLTPASTTAGSAALTLTVNGSSFLPSAVVRWNGADRVTTFVSATRLTAQISANDLASAGSASITVFQPANVSGGGGVSNALTFTITTPPHPAPTLALLAPSNVVAGNAAFTLTVTGANFVTGARLRWNDGDRPTTFVSATQLTAVISASDVASAGIVTITVFNPANASGGGGLSNALLFTINQPAPTLTSVTPNTLNAGGGLFTLTANGSGFVAGSVVRWNGQARTTAFVSATQLTAQIPAADVASTGMASVTIFNPAPGGGVSNAIVVTINQAANPMPTLTTLSPNTATAGSAGLTLQVTGSNFVGGATVRWNGANRPTTFVSATQLTAQLMASDLATPTSASITVSNPASTGGGGGTSNALTFTVTAQPNPTPTLTALTPASATAGGAAFTLTATGTNFVSGARLVWQGSERPTTFVSATQLTAQISAADIATAGTASVTINNPASAGGGGGISNALTFTINAPANPVPTLTALAPSLVAAGSAAFTLTVTGTNFLANSVVRWNNADRPTTFVSATQLRAEIAASDIINAGTASVTVFNPTSPSGGGTSNPRDFTIASAVASVSAASYSGAEIARNAIVAAFGANLATGLEIATTLPLPTSLRGTTVSVRDALGVDRLAPLFFVAPTQVNYLMPADTAPGPATITITNSDGRISLGTTRIANVAPGIFTADSNGRGVAAALALRVRADGSQSFEPVAGVSPVPGVQAAIPINLGPEGEFVFLILYGTGWRNRGLLANGTPNVQVTFGTSTTGTVAYAGAQGSLAGLDQINVLIPRSLAGSGEVDVAVLVDGKPANIVRIHVR